MMRAVTLIAFSLAVALPGVARAMYDASGKIPEVFSPVTGTPINTYKGGSSDQKVTLPFPFKFYGVTYESVRVGYRGYISFDQTQANTSTVYGIPSKNHPFTVIAPWWGNWGADRETVSHATLGVAPNRIFVVQWRNVYYTNDPRGQANGATFQARLYENGYKIQFAYGTSGLGNYAPQSSIRAAVGIQNATGTQGTAGLGCTTGSSAACGSIDFPENSVITFAEPADLTITRVYADEIGYAGVPMRMGVSVLNQGGNEAIGATIGFYYSSDQVFDDDDRPLEISRAVDIGIGQRREVVVTATLPSDLESGTHYIFARADPFNHIREINENNNIGPVGGLPFSIGSATPDLTVGSITIPATARAGETITVSGSIRNVGSLHIGACTVDADCGSGICDAGRCRAACSEPSDCAAPLTCDVDRGICEKPACTLDADCGDNEACNAGTCEAKKITYSVYLSENSVISLADRKLNTDLLELSSGIPAFGEVSENIDVTLPSDLGPREYYVGFIVDPENSLKEISKVNNSGPSLQPVTILTDTVTVLTSSLPDAAIQAPYGVRVKAAGGNGTFTFSLASGNLPPGLNLAAHGDISGIPLQTGDFEFRVQVESGTATATRDLAIKVNHAIVPLTLVTRELPAAEFGAPYSVKLSAVGGTAPYRWQLSEGAHLPPGLALSTDGTIEGQPEADGVFEFQVEVEDSAGGKQAAPLTLQVTSPDRMRIASTSLPAATLGVPYEAVLSAVGGTAPYVWKVVESRLLPLGATDTPEPATTEPPAGLTIATRGGVTVLTGTPALAGTWAITLEVEDADGKSDVASLVLPVRPDVPLQVATRGLPDAVIGKPYSAQLYADGAKGAVVWSVTCTPTTDPETGGVVPCPRALPESFELTPEGLITTGEAVVAKPVAADGSELARETHRFMVKAVDESGRSAIAAMSITVRPEAEKPAPPETSTCQTGFGAPSLPLAGLLAVFSLTLLRRRRTN